MTSATLLLTRNWPPGPMRSEIGSTIGRASGWASCACRHAARPVSALANRTNSPILERPVDGQSARPETAEIPDEEPNTTRPSRQQQNVRQLRPSSSARMILGSRLGSSANMNWFTGCSIRTPSSTRRNFSSFSASDRHRQAGPSRPRARTTVRPSARTAPRWSKSLTRSSGNWSMLATSRNSGSNRQAAE